MICLDIKGCTIRHHRFEVWQTVTRPKYPSQLVLFDRIIKMFEISKEFLCQGNSWVEFHPYPL